MFELIIDNRENYLIQLFEKNNIPISKQNLDIGDIIIQYQSKPIIIIERKTLTDLSSSIKDGRYKEQKIRLVNTHKTAKKIYLIEKIGHFTLDNSIYESVKVNSILRDDIFIYETQNLQKSYEFILKIMNNVKKYEDKWTDKGIEVNYVESVYVNKKKNMDNETIAILQLSVIPGVSKNIASKLLEHFDNDIKNFFALFQSSNEETFIINELANINTGKKKLGKKLAQKIMAMYYNI